MDPESKHLTAFSFEYGLFQFNVMPMELTNAPATFQRIMNKIFKDLIEQNIVVVFLDDFLVLSPHIETDLKNIKVVTERLMKHGIKVKLNKCVQLALEVKFLGRVISLNSIKPDEDKISAVKNFPLPENLENLQSFMGLCCFFRKYIRSYAHISQPLYQLMIIKTFPSSLKNKI
ncbi:unnamed protein product [Brachionus calyciflorus]|uniref:Reverse transcriptase domain-containing protein n=1 Tax=Brachionus calyciflorus TaxID=104777 RepID=A0A814HCQ2_9BILA|nr:unnamed protein product [Brachionus calyciflorus]